MCGKFRIYEYNIRRTSTNFASFCQCHCFVHILGLFVPLSRMLYKTSAVLENNKPQNVSFVTWTLPENVKFPLIPGPLPSCFQLSICVPAGQIEITEHIHASVLLAVIKSTRNPESPPLCYERPRHSSTALVITLYPTAPSAGRSTMTPSSGSCLWGKFMKFEFQAFWYRMHCISMAFLTWKLSPRWFWLKSGTTKLPSLLSRHSV